MKHFHDKKPSLEGHCLIHNKWDHSHVMQFVVTDDGSFVKLLSWNAPTGLAAPWVLVAERVMKLNASRVIWKDLRDRGYHVLNTPKRDYVCP